MSTTSSDASSWNGVIERLQAAGVGVTAPPNLRGLSADSAYIESFSEQIPGPVLVVAHSYAGAVISNAAADAKNVVGLVFVAAFATDEGETVGGVARQRDGGPAPQGDGASADRAGRFYSFTDAEENTREQIQKAPVAGGVPNPTSGGNRWPSSHRPPRGLC